MVQMEVSNMYIDMGVNNGSEKWTGKNTAELKTLPDKKKKTSNLLEFSVRKCCWVYFLWFVWKKQ